MTTHEEINEILVRNGERFDYKITFPKYRELPEEVLLALKVLQNHGMKILLSVIPDKKEDVS